MRRSYTFEFSILAVFAFHDSEQLLNNSGSRRRHAPRLLKV